MWTITQGEMAKADVRARNNNLLYTLLVRYSSGNKSEGRFLHDDVFLGDSMKKIFFEYTFNIRSSSSPTIIILNISREPSHYVDSSSTST